MLLFIWLCLLLLSSHASNVLQSLQNSSEWWMLRNTTKANIYYGVEGKLIFLRHAMMDVRNIHSCYEYKVYDIATQLIEKSRTFCYPAVIISGYKKCSTSALFVLMTQYSEVLRDHGKENCIFGNEGGSNVVGLFDTYPAAIKEHVLLVSGCIYWDRNYIMDEVLHRPNTFYLMIYRNYADFLWSAYNYWCSFPYDQKCRYENQWVIARKFTRSPELFHAMVEGSVKGANVSAPEVMQNACQRGGVLFSNLTQHLWASVRPENTLILSSEELDSNSNQTWRRVAAALGFRRPHKKLAAFEKVKINVNGYKGAERKTDASLVSPGLYEVSGFRPMMNSSRQWLDRCWARDACFVSQVTGHHYSACDSKAIAITSSGGGGGAGVYPSEQQAAASLRRYQATRLNESYVRSNPFTRAKVKQCSDFIHSLTSSSSSSSSSSITGGCSSGSSSGSHTGRAGGKGLRVLLLSTSPVRRTVATFLSLFLTSPSAAAAAASGSGHSMPPVITTVELSDYSDSSSSSSALTQHTKELLCGDANSSGGAGVTIVTADPSDVTLSPSGEQRVTYFRRQEQRQQLCGVGADGVRFDKLIALVDLPNDPLLLAWKLFKEQSGYGDGRTPEESTARFDWTRWSDHIAQHVTTLLGDDKEDGRTTPAHVWPSAVRRVVNQHWLAPSRSSSDRGMVVDMRDLRAARGVLYRPLLDRLSVFLHLSVSPALLSLPLPPSGGPPHESLDPLHCASLVAADALPQPLLLSSGDTSSSSSGSSSSSSSQREALLASLTEAALAEERRNLLSAYASNREVCEVERLLAGRPLESSMLRRPLGTSHCTDSSSSSSSSSSETKAASAPTNTAAAAAAQDQYNLCAARYSSHVRRTDASAPAAAALLAQPGPEAVSARLLLQFSTGISTGGSNRYRGNYEGVEGVECGVGVLLTHIAANEVQWFPGNRTLTSSISRDHLNCDAGPMSFARAIVLVSDPMLAVLREALQTTSSSGSSSGGDSGGVDSTELHSPTAGKRRKRRPTPSAAAATGDETGGSLASAARQMRPHQLLQGSEDLLRTSRDTLTSEGTLLVVSYEELAHSSALQRQAVPLPQDRSSSTSSSSSSSTTTLRRILSFLGWSPVDETRLVCLPHLMRLTRDSQQLLQTVHSSVAALQEWADRDRADFCEARKTVQETLRREKLEMRLLLDDLLCQ